MKYFIFCFLIVTIFSPMSSAVAHNKVVVIPMPSAKGKQLNNVVTVSAKGGDFSDPVAAINSITDADSNKPYLIIIGPGVYTLNETLNMKRFVSIAGAGVSSTKLTGSISTGATDPTSAIVSGADEATLSDLYIENIGGGGISLGLYNGARSPIIENVKIKAMGGSGLNIGMYNVISSPTITNVDASGTGGNRSMGVFNDKSSPIMTNVNASGSGGGSQNTGVYNDESSPKMTNVNASGSGGEQSIGVFNLRASSPNMTNVDASATNGSIENNGVRNLLSTPIMTNMKASASNGATNYGVIHLDSFVFMTEVIATTIGGTDTNIGVYSGVDSTTVMERCTAEGLTNAVFMTGGGVMRVRRSSLLGSATPGTGILTCLYSSNRTDVQLDRNCQEIVI